MELASANSNFNKCVSRQVKKRVFEENLLSRPKGCNFPSLTSFFSEPVQKIQCFRPKDTILWSERYSVLGVKDTMFWTKRYSVSIRKILSFKLLPVVPAARVKAKVFYNKEKFLKFFINAENFLYIK